MHRSTLALAALTAPLLLALPAQAQTILSRYNFDGDLLNASTFVDVNMVEAPDGTFRQGATVLGSTAGTPTFARGVNGTPGGALALDGVDDWIDLTVDGHPGDTVPLTGTYGPGLVSGTVMAWVRVSDPLDQASRWLLGNANAADTQSYRFGFNGERLESHASGSASADSKFTVADSSANTAWADGQWHHIAAAWDGFANNGRVYVDGLPVGEPSTGTTLTAATPQTAWESVMALGARNNGGTLEGFWSGLVDDLRIYGPQLSNSQVLNIFNAVDVAPDPDPADADFDGDGDADGADFLIWQRGVGVGATFAEGDADEDGTVDGVDLAIWENVYGAPGVAAVAVVPEPTAVSLFILGVLSVASLARRRLS